MRTSEEIRAEIETCLGFFPPFFAPALETPPVLDNLWQDPSLVRESVTMGLFARMGHAAPRE